MQELSFVLYIVSDSDGYANTFPLLRHIFKVTRSASFFFYRFEDIPEVIDDSLPGPMHDSLSDSFVDQDVILEM